MNLRKYYGKSYKESMNNVHRVGYANRILNMVNKYKNQGNLLELGCYDGSLLLEAKKRGFNVCVYEEG